MFNTLKLDFNQEMVNNWSIVNDGVMGGLSSGNIEVIEQGFRFYGTVSLKNNGGFTTFRSPKRDYDIQKYSQVSIRYKSKGVAQALQLSVDERFYVPNYKAHLLNSEEWTIMTFQLNELQQYRLGEATGEYLNKEAMNNIIRLSFITDEKEAAKFSLSVDYVLFE